MAKHPIQPLYEDKEGRMRFKQNEIVRFLLNNGGIDMNKLAVLEFSQEDREQFAQLIGYPLSGFSELPYAGTSVWATAQTLYESADQTELQARVAYLESTLEQIRTGLAAPLAILYGKHPDDFEYGSTPI